MAANMDAMLRIAAKVEGANAIQAFSRDLKGLDGAARLSTKDLGHMNIAINRMAREAGNTTSGIRTHISALENLRSRVDIGGKAYNRLGNEIGQLRGKLRGLDGEVKKAGINLPKVLAGSAGALLAGAGAGVAGAGVTVAAIGRVGVTSETAQVRLKALTEQFGEYNQAQAAAARIAATLRISTIETQNAFANLYNGLRAGGFTLQEIEEAYIGITAAARNAGATSAKTQELVYQVTQALQSGVLQGDELRKIREEAPALLRAIAKEAGVTTGELKKLGADGKLTSDILIRAARSLTGEVAKLGPQFNTSSQALQDLRVATENFGVTVARVFGPATVALIRGVTSAIQYANELTQNPFERAKAAQFIGPQPSPERGAFSLQQQQARDAAARERQLGRQRAAAGAGSAAGGSTATAAQSNLNQLLIENLRLNTELGNVGKDRISQLNAEIELIPQVLKLQLSVLNASVKGKDLQQSRINANTEAQTRLAQLGEELQGVNKEVSSIANQAASLRVSTLSGLLPKGSPLQEEVRKVKEDLLAADDAAAELLSRLSGLAGTNPAGAAARAAIGNLRGDVASADPGAIASQRLLQGDTDALRQQITELQNAGRELSTLEQLAMKYGAEWDQIDPKIRASVGALAQQRDQLQENVNKTKEWNDTLNQAGKTIGGVLSDLVTGTNDWKSSLSGALKALANMALQSALMGLGGNDGKGFFSFITGTLKSFDGGGYTGNRPKSGGMDGRGGFMAMLHPQETVIDHTRAMPRQGAANPINVVVNVDAKGSQVEGSQTEGAALGRVISAAVQAELVKQQRPNGILGGGRR